jgi:hypothetical protein
LVSVCQNLIGCHGSSLGGSGLTNQ